MARHVKIYGRPTDLRYPTDEQWQQIKDLYDRPNKGAVVCDKPHGGPMYFQKRHDSLWAIHYPGYGNLGCRYQVGGEGPSHKIVKDFCAQAAEKAGFDVDEEFSTGRGTVVDLRICAPKFTFGIEAQLSPKSDRDILGRTTKSKNAGVPPVWVTREYMPWQEKAPTIRSDNVDWDSGMPPMRAPYAKNIKRIIAEPCTPSSRLPRCPDRRAGWCYRKRHPWYEPVVEDDSITLADAIWALGDQNLAFHSTRRGTALIVPTTDLTLYTELTGLSGLFEPHPALAPVVTDSGTCRADRPTWSFIMCVICGRELMHPESKTRGICERCWIDYGLRDGRAFQLPLFPFAAV